MAGRNPRLSDAIDDYLLTRRAAGIAPSTIAQNKSHLLQFLAEVGNIQVANLHTRHIDMVFQRWAANSTGTINASASSLRTFMDWAARRGMTPRGVDLLAGYRRHRKVPETSRTLVPVDKFPVLLDTAKHPRDRMVMALGLYLFLRQSEMRTLRIGDVDLTNQEVAVTVHKTKQFDRMPICAELETELRQWLTWYSEEKGPLQREWYLVPSKDHVPFTRDPLTKRWLPDTDKPARLKPASPMATPHRIVQRSLASLGYETFQEGVHTLRRSGARARFDALREQGYDGALQEVRAMLHHASVAMTEHYLGIHVERLRRNESVKGRPLYPTIAHSADKVVRIAK
jgi:integrase